MFFESGCAEQPTHYYVCLIWKETFVFSPATVPSGASVSLVHTNLLTMSFCLPVNIHKKYH